MVSLTQAAIITKKLMIIAVIATIILTISIIALKITSEFIKKVNPPKPPPPTVLFGKLPPLNLENVKTITTSEGLNFKIDTVEGGLPVLPDKALVFQTKKDDVGILSLDKATEKVKKIGLLSQPEKISETVYKWHDPVFPSRQLTLNLTNQNFEFSYNYISDPEILQKPGLVDEKEAIKIASRFLARLEVNVEELASEKTSTKLLNISGGKLVNAQSLGEADLVRVNFTRPNLEGLPFISPFPDKSNISVLVAPFSLTNSNKQIVEANYIHWKINQSKSATYPIKTAIEAFEQLKAGKGFITAKFDDSSTVILRRIFLAYLELPGDQPEYIQPVIVFEGDNGFRAILPAITDEYISQVPKNQ